MKTCDKSSYPGILHQGKFSQIKNSDFRKGIQGFRSPKGIFVAIIMGTLLSFSSLGPGMSNILQCKGQSHIGIVLLLRHNRDASSNLKSNRIS